MADLDQQPGRGLRVLPLPAGVRARVRAGCHRLPQEGRGRVATPDKHTAMAEESARIDGDFLCVLYHSHEGPPVFAADPARIQGVDV